MILMPGTTNEQILDCPRLNWGILGCGRISHDFTQALKLIPSAKVVACAGRSMNSAQSFAETHGIPKYYGSYEELLASEEVQVIYVGTIHTTHHDVGVKCLMANKHVLIEKPIACNAQEAESLINLAKERNLFLMEAMWTNFFPAVQHAKQMALGTNTSSSTIGQVVSVQSDFNFNSSDCEEYPTSPSFNRELAGGASYWVGSYPVAASTLYHGGKAPHQVSAVGFVDPNTGVDLQSSMSIRYPPSSQQECYVEEEKKHERKNRAMPIAGMSTLTMGFLAESPQETVVVGTHGRITLHAPAHCPTKVSLRIKSRGRGKGKNETYRYPLPKETAEIEKCGGFYFPGSAGLAYEAAAVARCINASLVECPSHSWADTLLNMQILEEMRSQIGLASS